MKTMTYILQDSHGNVIVAADKSHRMELMRCGYSDISGELTEVKGDLYVRADVTLPALTSVGGGLYVYAKATLNADALTSVGGDLYVSAKATLNAPLLKR